MQQTNKSAREVLSEMSTKDLESLIAEANEDHSEDKRTSDLQPSTKPTKEQKLRGKDISEHSSPSLSSEANNKVTERILQLVKSLSPSESESKKRDEFLHKLKDIL